MHRWFAFAFCHEIRLDCMRCAWTLDAQFWWEWMLGFSIQNRIHWPVWMQESLTNILHYLNTISDSIRFDCITNAQNVPTESGLRSKHSGTVAIRSTTFDGKWTTEDAYFCLILCVYHSHILLRKESNWVKEHVQLCTL